MYQDLYRKYRTIDFDSVVGQNTIVKTLLNSVKYNSLTHAYMFFGPRGTGKTTVSKIFARAANCLDPIDGNSCGKCKNCLHSFEKECVDIIEIDAASNNGVEEIRELRNNVSLVPAELKYKVYIIDEVHMLSTSAFNAFLKTLEEPPEHVIFILATTDPQKVPETIISRCQCFSFRRISDEMIVERLKFVCKEEKIDIDDEVLMEIAVASDGGMRDSLGMLDKLRSYTDEKITLEIFAELNGMITSKNLYELCNDIFSGNLSEVLLKITKFNNEGKNLIQIMSQLMHFSRNLLVDYYISNKNLDFSLDLVQIFVNLINENMFEIKRSSNPKIFIEMLLIKFINDNILNKKYFPGNNLVNVNSNVEIKENPIVKEEVKIVEKVVEKVIVKEEPEVNVVTEKIVDTTKEVVEEPTIKDVSNTYDSEDDSTGSILNINDIMKARVNNTMALANKQLLKFELDNMNILEDFTFDQEVGYVVCAILDGKIRAVSEDSLILSYEYDSVVKQNLNIIDKITYVYNKLTNSNKKIAIISDEQWEIEKNKYIASLKDGNHYEVVEEPEEIYEEVEKDDIIVSSAVELFGDIVEFE